MPIDMSNNSFAQDNRAAGSDEASVAGVLSQSARDGGTSLGIGANQNRGIDLRGANSSTVNFTDGGAFDLARDLSSSFTTTLSDLLNTQAETDAASQNSLLSSLLTGFGSLVETKNTGGDSSRNSIILWLGLAAIAVLGLFMLRKRA